MKKAVFGLVSNEDQARRVVDRLLAAGFTNEDISILFPENANQRTTGMTGSEKQLKRGSLSTEKHSKAPEGGVTGATAGGILGGSLGLLAGIGALAIPGVGPFIAAGPIMAALSGSAIGGGLGLLLGTLAGYGVPEYEAKKYETGLKAGNILMSVHAEDSEECKRAQDIFRKEGARDISEASEKAIKQKTSRL